MDPTILDSTVFADVSEDYRQQIKERRAVALEATIKAEIASRKQ